MKQTMDKATRALYREVALENYLWRRYSNPGGKGARSLVVQLSLLIDTGQGKA